LGQINASKEQWLEAAEYFELFLEKNPEDKRRGWAVYDLGLAYEQMGQIGRASVETKVVLKNPG